MATDSEDLEATQKSAKGVSETAHEGESTGDQGDDGDEHEEEEDDEEEEEDEEPKLKYTRLTGKLGPVYRNGDATSAFLVAGDKMYIGTHNGNIHVISLPSFQVLRVYHAHSASITGISISPFPPPIASAMPEAINRVVSESQQTPRKPSSVASGSSTTPRSPRPQLSVPNIPSNQIYIATSSLDGNVCVQSLVEVKVDQLRNFARPVQAVALSPDYKNDRMYISGGLAGSLILTVGGRAGISSTSTTTGTAAAAASGWLNTIGLTPGAGKDNVLHSGEGTISTIKWSLSGKYVVWANEQGIKIMRSNMHLDSADAESAWKRIAHVDRPQDNGWDEMASVWKARVEWIDEQNLETDDDDKSREIAAASPAAAKLKQQSSKLSRKIEKLLVGWGGTMWIINVHPDKVGTGKNVGERSVGRAEIIKILRMDCIISGLSLYTPTLLVVLAYITPDEEEEEEEEEKSAPSPVKSHKSKPSTASTGSEPRGGIRHRQNALSPELRLIDLASSEEIDTDGLTVSRFERLSSSDYHMSVLPASRGGPSVPTPKGTLETLAGMGSGMWNATLNATNIRSSSASVLSSGRSSDGDSNTKVASSISGMRARPNYSQPAHPNLTSPSMKIFIHSPYDCILATKRDLSDHLSWLLEQDKYEEAWELIDEHPEVISSSAEKLAEVGPGTPEKGQSGSDDFYETSSAGDSASRLIHSSVEKEKRRIGELWIQQLISAGNWTAAGQVCGKVLGTSTGWEHWVWTFAGANKFDEITNYIPTATLQPPLPSTIYEVVLGHYIAHDRLRLRELLDMWPAELFDVRAVTTALENQLTYRDVREDSIEGGEKGRDWRIVMESLGKLYAADGRPREALKCYINLQDADAAMGLIKDFHLVDAVADDVPSLILLRVSKEQLRSAPIKELEEASSEAIELLVNEAQHGLLRPEVVVKQLQEKELPLFLFFYLRSLWNGGEASASQAGETRDRLVLESKTLVDEFADLTIRLFASFDRPLLMKFLKTSTSYSFEKACLVCEERDYIPELVYLYSKTGQTKRALYLIIDRLADVSQAIAFAKEQDDEDLWEDLLEYSMDKPRFIRGLLEEVGTSIDPIRLVRRIPEGLEIEGLREGLSRMIKEYELQFSISEGVARVLRGEVASAQVLLRNGQRKGVRFDIARKGEDHVDITATDVHVPVSAPPLPEIPISTVTPSDARPQTPTNTGKTSSKQNKSSKGSQDLKPGHCVGCHEPFTENEKETLVGFACGHVFHLNHLLHYMNPDSAEDLENGLTVDGVLDEEGHYPWTHSVGAKVTHARLLREKIGSGCPVCTQAAVGKVSV